MSDAIESSEELAKINRKIVADGETLPSVKLKDGTRAQTGTVATMLHNVGRYNTGERGQVEEELKLAIPTLIKVGLFALFTPQEWISGKDNPGRKFLGEEAIRYLRQRSETPVLPVPSLSGSEREVETKPVF